MSKMDEVELTFYRRMMAQVQAGGWLVASSACGTVEIAWARTEGRMFVDQDGIGYVVRPAASMPAPVESAPMPSPARRGAAGNHLAVCPVHDGGRCECGTDTTPGCRCGLYAGACPLHDHDYRASAEAAVAADRAKRSPKAEPSSGAVMVAVDAFADARDACLRAEHARGWKEAVEACARLFSPLATRYDGETVIARILHQLHDSTTFTRPDQEKKT